MKKSSRRLMLIIMALVITLAVGTTSTYAWFTLTDIAVVENILLQVNVSTGVQIAGGHPGKDDFTDRWFSNLTNEELLLANGYLPTEGTESNATKATNFLAKLQLVDLSPQLYTPVVENAALNTISWANNVLTDGDFALVNADGTSPDYVYTSAYVQRYLTAWMAGIYPANDTDHATPIEFADFEAKVYDVQVSVIDSTKEPIASVDQKGYLAFDISLRTAKDPDKVDAAGYINGYIPVYLKTSSTGVVQADADNFDPTNVNNIFSATPIAADTYGFHPVIGVDAEIKADPANAARFGFVPYNSSEDVEDINLPKFTYLAANGKLLEADKFFGDADAKADAAYARIYDPRHNQGYYLNDLNSKNLARRYYLAYNNIANMSVLTDMVTFGYSYYNADQAEAAVLTALTAGETEFGRLYLTDQDAGNGQNYYQGSIRVYIWAEGKDGDCFNSIIGGMFNSQIAFTIPTIV